MLIQHKEFAAELAKIFAGAPSATVATGPTAPPERTATMRRCGRARRIAT
jgi:hypothetical protein